MALCPSARLTLLSGRERPIRKTPTVFVTRCQAQSSSSDVQVQRRALLASVAGLSLATVVVPDAFAISPGANVFGPLKSKRTEFIPYKAQGFALMLPSKWNPASSKGAYPGVVLKYEDNGDQGNNLEVVKKTTSKKSIKEYGDPQKFLQEVKFIFGDNVWKGSTRSEGGFKENQVYSTSILNIEDTQDQKGNDYYRYEILNRTADGTAGGTHILLSAAVSGGALNIFKVQILDKRWVRGADRDGKGAFNSFTVV